ncbi:MAG: glycosyltransferase family 39 protein [Candidatus Methylomirabilis sp.]
MKRGPELGGWRWSHRAIGEVGLVLVVTIVGGWLRFQGLGRDSLWSDEAASFLQTSLPLPKLLPRVARNVHPPLYFLLLHGILTFGDSETLLRWPSALFGTLSIPLLYLFGRALFGGPVGLLAALLLAVSPLHLWHSQDARMYTFLTFEGLLSWLLFASLLRGQRPSLWVGYVLASEAILYTHYYGALLLLAQAGVVGLLHRRGEVGRQFWSRWLVVQLGLGLLFLPWLVYAFPSIQLSRSTEWIGEGIRHDPLWLVKRLAAFSVGSSGRLWLLGIPVLALALIGLFRDESLSWRPLRSALRERGVLLCLGYFAVPIAVMVAVSLLRPLLVSRHLLMTAPAFFLLAAVGLSRLLPERLLIPGALALVLVALPGLIGWRSIPRTPDLRGAVRVILTDGLAGDLVLSSPPGRGTALRYYVRPHKSGLRMCSQLWSDSPPEKVQACLRDARRVWVVFSRAPSRFGEPTFLASLAGRFRIVRTDELFQIRVVLYAETDS